MNSISEQKASLFEYWFTQDVIDLLHLSSVCLQSKAVLNVFISCYSFQDLNQTDDNENDDDSDEFNFNMSDQA